MAVATLAVAHVPLSASQADVSDGGDYQAPIETVNALIEKNVATYSQSPYLGYPKTARGKGDYVYHTFQQINNYVNEAAWRYTEGGLGTEVRYTPPVARILS